MSGVDSPSNDPGATASQPVEHDAAGQRFVIRLPGGEEAVLTYGRSGKILDFIHTFVPPALRGQGLADRVVRAGFDYARERGLKVVPSCPYVGTWLRRHPEEQDLAQR